MITIVTFRNWKRKTHCWQDLWWTSYIGELETDKIWRLAIAKGKQCIPESEHSKNLERTYLHHLFQLPCK
jgi:hypothetical protein